MIKNHESFLIFKKCQSIVVGQTSSVPHIGVPSALTLCYSPHRFLRLPTRGEHAVGTLRLRRPRRRRIAGLW